MHACSQRVAKGHYNFVVCTIAHALYGVVFREL